jgi:hypothetical protein
MERGRYGAAVHHTRRGTTGRRRKLTAAEEGEIFQRAHIQWAEHHAVDAAWTRAMIDDVTQGRFPAVPASFISRFWDRVQWPMRRVQDSGLLKSAPPSMMKPPIFSGGSMTMSGSTTFPGEYPHRGRNRYGDEGGPRFKGTPRKQDAMGSGLGQRPKAREPWIEEDVGDRLRHIQNRYIVGRFSKVEQILDLKRRSPNRVPIVRQVVLEMIVM